MKNFKIVKIALFSGILFSALANADMSVTYSTDDGNRQGVQTYNNSGNVYYNGYNQYPTYDPNYTTESSYQYISPNTTIIIRDNIRPVYPYPPQYYPYPPRPHYNNHHHRPDYHRPPPRPPKHFPDRPNNGNQNNVPRPPPNMSKPVH